MEVSRVESLAREVYRDLTTSFCEVVFLLPVSLPREDVPIAQSPKFKQTAEKLHSQSSVENDNIRIALR